VQVSLKKARKELKVEVGSIPQPGVSADTGNSNSGDPDGDEMLRSTIFLQHQKQYAQAMGTAAQKGRNVDSALQDQAPVNGFMQRYFQVPPPSLRATV
jgi:hypothetical protein